VVVAPEVDHARVPVLVIEDEIEPRLLYEKYLRGTGFQPVTARSLREARAILETLRPGAIILDIMLRGEEGWSLLPELKSNPATRDLPVLVITNVDDRVKAMSLGADAFAHKPVERRWLLDHLHRFAGSSLTRKVVLIDDEEVSRYLLRQLFPTPPCQVMEAANGMEGLKLAREELPQLILLDLLMPELGGLDVLERLRADQRTKEIPVIVSSSSRIDNDERSRIEGYGAGFLPKYRLTDGTAAGELRRLCIEMGVGDLVTEEIRPGVE